MIEKISKALDTIICVHHWASSNLHNNGWKIYRKISNLDRVKGNEQTQGRIHTLWIKQHIKSWSTPFELNNISNLGVYLQHCFLCAFDRVYVVWASFVLLELIAYTSYKDHEWPFACHKAIGWLLKTSLGLENRLFDVFKVIFIDRSIVCWLWAWLHWSSC